MLVKEKSELKRMAATAKSRLKFGYYNKKNEDVVNYLEYGALLVSKEEELMYRKVADLLESHEFVINPIGRLIDRRVYDNMNQSERIKYVLELSKTYIRLQTRYFQERGFDR